MAQPSLETPRRARRSLFTRIAPAALALTFATWAGTQANASEAGRLAINNKLADFKAQTFNSSTTAQTTLTATADDLINAVVSVLLTNNSIPVEEVAEGALRAVTISGVQTARKDKDKVADRLVDAIVRLMDPNDTARIALVVDKVAGVNNNGAPNFQSKVELTISTRAAVAAAALRLATGANAGNNIAAASIKYIKTPPATDPANIKNVENFAVGALNLVGNNASQVKSFVDGIFDSGALVDDAASRQTYTFEIAKKLKNLPAVGETIGAAAQATGLSDSGVTSLANAALADAKLVKAAAFIVSSTADELDTTSKSQFAQTLAGTQTKIDIKGQIAAGAINAGLDSEAVGILDAVRTAGNITAAKDLVTYGVAAGTGNTGEKIRLISDNIANQLPDDASRTSLGTGLVKNVATLNPYAAGNVATGIFSHITGDKTVFAQNLAKAAPTNGTAVGAVAAAVADLLPNGQEVALSASIIKVAAKAATSVAQQVSALAQVTDRVAFAKNLVLASPTASSPITVGVSQTAPQLADTIVDGVVLLVDGKGKSPFKANAAKIAGDVAYAVDVEKAADIATKVSSRFTLTGAGVNDLKLSQASTLASALAKAVNTQPRVSTANRADELGEIAASIVSQVLGKSGTDSKGLANESKLVASIGTSIIKALSTKAAQASTTLAADQRAAGDIAGSIAQVIALAAVDPDGSGPLVALISAAQRDALLASGGTLEKTLSKAVGKNYQTASAVNPTTVLVAFADVRQAVANNPNNPIVPGSEPIGTNGTATKVGKYEIGSVNDPETPHTNI